MKHTATLNKESRRRKKVNSSSPYPLATESRPRRKGKVNAVPGALYTYQPLAGHSTSQSTVNTIPPEQPPTPSHNPRLGAETGAIFPLPTPTAAPPSALEPTLPPVPSPEPADITPGGQGGSYEDWDSYDEGDVSSEVDTEDEEVAGVKPEEAPHAEQSILEKLQALNINPRRVLPLEAVQFSAMFFVQSCLGAQMMVKFQELGFDTSEYLLPDDDDVQPRLVGELQTRFTSICKILDEHAVWLRIIARIPGQYKDGIPLLDILEAICRLLFSLGVHAGEQDVARSSLQIFSQSPWREISIPILEPIGGITCEIVHDMCQPDEDHMDEEDFHMDIPSVLRPFGKCPVLRTFSCAGLTIT
jgi:hypothetical protein